jgi:suppressor of ftsI
MKLGRGIVGALMAVVGIAVGGVAAGTAGAAAPARPDCHRDAPPLIRDGFPEPPMRYSRGGLLETSMRASVGPVTIDGRRTIAMNYEGSYPGPTLVVCAGDRMIVHFKNDLPDPTNLHTHGFHISPSGNQDNVYLDIKPGQRFTYRYQIPLDNPPGAYWYHPHHHMYVEPQIFGGLAGAIVEEGGLDRLPSLRHVPQRWMMIQSSEVRGGKVLPVADSVEADTPLRVNGVVNPTVKIRPGQLQRWRIFNANDNRIVVLHLAGQNLQVLAEDGNTLPSAKSVGDLMIAPGSRREVLVRGGRPGSYPLKAKPFAQFPGGKLPKNGGPTPNQTVLTMRSDGKRAAVEPAAPRGALSHPVDLRSAHVDRRRTIVFNETPLPGDNTAFTFNGMTFDPNRVLTMKLNSLEEWTLVNANTEWHTFHIHVNDFQVISVAGRRRNYVDYEDNVALPPRSKVVIRMRPTDFTGKFVFHCHVTFHEDHGMMAAVQVLRHPSTAQLQAATTSSDGLTLESAAYGSNADPAFASTVTDARSFFLLCQLGATHAVVDPRRVAVVRAD